MTEQQPSLLKRFHNNKNAQRLLLALTIIYVISPVDAIPDVMPVIGWLDDAGIIIAEIAQFLVYLNNKKASFEKKVQEGSIEGKEEDK